MSILIRENLYKMIHDKSIMAVEVVSIIVIIGISLFFLDNSAVSSRIAVVNYSGSINVSDVEVSKFNKEVPLSDLVKGKYDAEIIFNKDKSYNVKYVSGKDTKKRIDNALKYNKPVVDVSEKRGVLGNIIGFSVMLIPMVALMLYKFFFKEKQGIAQRILSSNISYLKYCMSYIISSFIYVFMPTAAVCVVISFIPGIKVSMSVADILLSLFIIAFLGASFALMIVSFCKTDDDANMMGNMVIVISALLSGAMFSVSDNRGIDIISRILPQKYIVDAVNNMDKGKAFSLYGLIYALILAAIFIALAVRSNKHRLQKGIC